MKSNYIVVWKGNPMQWSESKDRFFADQPATLFTDRRKARRAIARSVASWNRDLDDAGCWETVDHYSVWRVR